MAGILWKVEKTTGATEQIADLGVTANRRSTGAFDTESGIFYVVVTNEDSSTIEEYGYSIGKSQLYAVDVAAGSAKLVYEFADGEAVRRFHSSKKVFTTERCTKKNCRTSGYANKPVAGSRCRK